MKVLTILKKYMMNSGKVHDELWKSTTYEMMKVHDELWKS